MACKRSKKKCNTETLKFDTIVWYGNFHLWIVHWLKKWLPTRHQCFCPLPMGVSILNPVTTPWLQCNIVLDICIEGEIICPKFLECSPIPNIKVIQTTSTKCIHEYNKKCDKFRLKEWRTSQPSSSHLSME